MMKERWLVAVVGLPLLLLLAVCPPWVTMLLVCAITGVAAYELLHTVGKSVGGIAYCYIEFVSIIQQAWLYHETRLGRCLFEPFSGVTLLRWLLVMFLFTVAVLTYGKPNAVTFSTVSAGVVGGIVFPAFYSCILLLRMREDYGELYVLTPFFIAFAGDALAMYFGKWWGGKKLTPVSPNKTWAGFWGGILGSVLGMLLFGLVGGRWLGYPANYLHLALVGAVANLAGQLGDLSMSLIKREAGVKDYSRLFLAHGGMLDRFDSTLFIAPVVYFFVNLGIV